MPEEAHLDGHGIRRILQSIRSTLRKLINKS